MGIKKDLKTGMWSVSYAKRHPVTRKSIDMKRKNIASNAEAKRVYAELIIKVNEKIKKKSVPLWSEFIEKYIDHRRLKGHKNGTIYGVDKQLKAHTLSVWGDKFIDEITTVDIHLVLNEKFKNYAEAHKKYFIKCVRGAFGYALELGLVIRNPTPLLKFKINDKIKPGLTEEQILLLLRKAQELDWHWYPHYAVAALTGLRNGELYALTWDQINFDKRQILVNKSWSNTDGYKSTKSGDDRIVEIPNPLMPLLKELKLNSAASDFVLPRLSKWDKGEQARELRFFLKSIGLHEIRFHDLRASWATMLLSNGVPPSQVMSMGGWVDMKTMMIYMRKAGINIKDSTSVLDHIEVHDVKMGKVMDFKPL